MLRMSMRVYARVCNSIYGFFENDDTFLNTPRHPYIRRPMNKNLASWLKRARQIDERVPEFTGRILEGGEGEW